MNPVLWFDLDSTLFPFISMSLEWNNSAQDCRVTPVSQLMMLLIQKDSPSEISSSVFEETKIQPVYQCDRMLVRLHPETRKFSLFSLTRIFLAQWVTLKIRNYTKDREYFSSSLIFQPLCPVTYVTCEFGNQLHFVLYQLKFYDASYMLI